ncbi:MAG: class I SAM-dependent methyltransferase [Isosphaerales bacterium]
MIAAGFQQILHGLRRRLGLYPGSVTRERSEKTSDWYDRLYDEAGVYQQPYYRSFYYFLWAVITDRLRMAGMRRVLEIGCGPGQLAAMLLEQGVEDYVGLDFSATAIAMARKNAPGGRFFVGDARTTRLHSEVEHEVIICTEVLEHIEDDLLTMSRFTHGRRCICSVPNFAYPGHVRYFRDAEEVRARYGPFFHDLDIMTFKSPYSTPGETTLFFLADGVRNDRIIEQDSSVVSAGTVVTPTSPPNGLILKTVHEASS